MTSANVTKTAVNHSKAPTSTIDIIRGMIKAATQQTAMSLGPGPYPGKILRTRKIQIETFIREYPSDLVAFILGISKITETSAADLILRTGHVWEVTAQVDDLRIFPVNTGPKDQKEDAALVGDFYKDYNSGNDSDFVSEYKDKSAAVELALSRMNRFHKAYYCIGLTGTNQSRTSVKTTGDTVSLVFLNKDFDSAKVV